MKTVLSFLLLFSLLIVSCRRKADHAVNVLTFNIRYDNPGDSANAWPYRKDMVADLIKYHEADLVGVQEAMLHQLKDMEERLPDHNWIGVGRDDGKAKGEFSALFYNSKHFQLLDSGTFWLSPTPDVPSKGWDAAIVRVCTWAKLMNRHLRKEVVVFNTHYDHIGEQARQESSKLLVEKIREIAGNLPVILTGDFNTEPGTPAYETVMAYLEDARDVSQMKPYGPEGTWNGFDYNATLDRRIDFVFVNGKVNVRKYAVLNDALEGRFPSDHLPVFVEAFF